MKRQRLISKGALSRLFEDAAEAWRRQAYQETIALLERASRLDPANVNVLFDLGRAYGLRYEYDSAEGCLEKAVSLAPRKEEALAEAGRRCQEFGNHEMAARYFERAARGPDTPAEALVVLAELYERAPRCRRPRIQRRIVPDGKRGAPAGAQHAAALAQCTRGIDAEHHPPTAKDGIDAGCREVDPLEVEP